MANLSIKERAMAGERICGTMIRVVRSPAMIHIAKNAGLDFVMYECEHHCFDLETLHDAFMVANGIGIEGWVRVPVPTKEYVSRYLDCGATGIMVPLIETAEQAKQLVNFAKYEPVGKRGFANSSPNTNYKPLPHKQIMEDANRRIMVIAQIETAKALENIDEIAAVEGLDALFIGPNDLSIALGIPGDLFNPIELEAISKVAKACRKTGKLFSVH